MANADQHRDQHRNTGQPPTDVEVWHDFTSALQGCLSADREISEHAGTPRGDAACERFDQMVTRALLAYADLQLRGLLGFFEDVLIERGMTGDADGVPA
jgi:hypothetical protein